MPIASFVGIVQTKPPGSLLRNPWWIGRQRRHFSSAGMRHLWVQSPVGSLGDQAATGWPCRWMNSRDRIENRPRELERSHHGGECSQAWHHRWTLAGRWGRHLHWHFPWILDVTDVRSQPDAIVPYFVSALLHTVGSQLATQGDSNVLCSRCLGLQSSTTELNCSFDSHSRS